MTDTPTYTSADLRDAHRHLSGDRSHETRAAARRVLAAIIPTDPGPATLREALTDLARDYNKFPDDGLGDRLAKLAAVAAELEAERDRLRAARPAVGEGIRQQAAAWRKLWAHAAFSSCRDISPEQTPEARALARLNELVAVEESTRLAVGGTIEREEDTERLPVGTTITDDDRDTATLETDGWRVHSFNYDSLINARWFTYPLTIDHLPEDTE